MRAPGASCVRVGGFSSKGSLGGAGSSSDGIWEKLGSHTGVTCGSLERPFSRQRECRAMQKTYVRSVHRVRDDQGARVSRAEYKRGIRKRRWEKSGSVWNQMSRGTLSNCKHQSFFSEGSEGLVDKWQDQACRKQHGGLCVPSQLDEAEGEASWEGTAGINRGQVRMVCWRLEGRCQPRLASGYILKAEPT